MKTQRRKLGDWGEQQAVLFLQKNRYTIVDRNFSVRGGEIDIIAWHTKPQFGQTLCFIEVKTRSKEEGSAERATHHNKLNNLFFAATGYCVEKGIERETTPIQFEQVSVYCFDPDQPPVIRHYVIPVE